MISVCFMYNLISVPLFACVPPTLHHIFPVLIRFPCSIPVPAKIIARFSITPSVCLTKFYQLRAGANKSKTPPPFAFYFFCTGICVFILLLHRRLPLRLCFALLFPWQRSLLCTLNKMHWFGLNNNDIKSFLITGIMNGHENYIFQ